MKKKILFIISSMRTGGVTKSLTTLMNVIDKERYDVSLMISSPKGELMELLPSNLHIITNPIWENLLDRESGIWGLFKSFHPILAFGHLIRLFISLFSKSMAAEMIARLMPPIKEKFDVAVDYNGQHQLYYMVNKINADKKVTFFHSDYEKWPFYYKSDKKYFPKVNYVFTISEKCVQSIQRLFPDVAYKTRMMENISSQSYIEKLSLDYIPEKEINGISLITIGRVCENKGILWAIEAARILKDKNIDFTWYFIGPVDKPIEYYSYIDSYKVSEQIKFLGVRINPYPYIRKSDIVVHPSKFEGRSIALDEAKLLCKPIVVTNFSTVSDQFIDRVNASICEMNAQSIADSIEELIKNQNLRLQYMENLRLCVHDNSAEIEKLYCIFDD